MGKTHNHSSPPRVIAWAGLLTTMIYGASTAQAADTGGVPVAVADGGLIEALMFYTIAGVVLVSGLGICLSRSVVRMAVWLFGALGAVAVLYFLLAATFLGAIQLIVYVGGTLILLVFGIMLTSQSPWVRYDVRGRELLAAGGVCVALAAVFIGLLQGTFGATEATEVHGATVHALGVELLTTYLVPFEVASVLLLVVMIGAAYLARQERT